MLTNQQKDEADLAFNFIEKRNNVKASNLLNFSIYLNFRFFFFPFRIALCEIKHLKGARIAPGLVLPHHD